MASSNRRHTSIPSLLALILFLSLQAPSSNSAKAFSIPRRSGEAVRTVERRSLLSFKETPKGANLTFDCSPSGPCVSCLYSEKNDDKYRCSETGYHIPLKCVQIKGASKVQNDKKSPKGRSDMESSQAKTPKSGEQGAQGSGGRLLGESSTLKGGSQAYITYRSCIPAVFEEKLSVLGFEAIMLGLLLISGPVVYFRRKRTIAMSGVGPARVQTNSRF